jgi:cytochrome P450
VQFSTIPFAGTHMDIPSITDLTQLSDFDEINQVLLSPKFVQGGFPESGKKFIAGVITLLDGKTHAQRRLVMSRMLNDNHVADMRETFLKPAIDQSLKEIAASTSSVDGIIHTDLVMLAQRSIHRIAAAVSGVDGINSPGDADRLIELVRRIAAGVTVQFSREPQEEVLRDAENAKQEFNREFFAVSLSRRMALAEELKAARISADGLPQDMLMQTVAHRDDVWSGDEDLPLREICHFLVGASQTTAGSLVLFILRLEQWFADHPDDRALVDSDPNFLRAAAYESLRLTVGAPARLRRATEDVTLKSGRTIKQGETIALLFIPANMSKSRFGEDADQFNPHRDVGSLTPWGLSFGAGAHACPGRPLVTGNRSMKAQTEVDGTLVTISRRLYASGLRLNEDRPPVPDPNTHYSVFQEVPIKFTNPKGMISEARAEASSS